MNGREWKALLQLQQLCGTCEVAGDFLYQMLVKISGLILLAPFPPHRGWVGAYKVLKAPNM